MLPGCGVKKKPGSRVLHVLEPVQGFTWKPRQDSVTVVQPGRDERMDECLCYRVRQRGMETENHFELVERRLDHGFNGT